MTCGPAGSSCRPAAWRCAHTDRRELWRHDGRRRKTRAANYRSATQISAISRRPEGDAAGTPGVLVVHADVDDHALARRQLGHGEPGVRQGADAGTADANELTRRQTPLEAHPSLEDEFAVLVPDATGDDHRCARRRVTVRDAQGDDGEPARALVWYSAAGGDRGRPREQASRQSQRQGGGSDHLLHRSPPRDTT